MAHSSEASPPALTYTTKKPQPGPTFTCGRCKRIYKYPVTGDPPIRCECGWWYTVRDGWIVEEFRHRLGRD